MGLMDNRCVIHVIDQDIQDHLREYISSKINEVIRAVLNSLLFFFFFFLQKDFARTKSTKSTKSIKSTKKHQKHQKHQQHQKHKKHEKHINANKRISDFFPLKFFLCS